MIIINWYIKGKISPDEKKAIGVLYGDICPNSISVDDVIEKNKGHSFIFLNEGALILSVKKGVVKKTKETIYIATCQDKSLGVIEFRLRMRYMDNWFKREKLEITKKILTILEK